MHLWVKVDLWVRKIGFLSLHHCTNSVSSFCLVEWINSHKCCFFCLFSDFDYVWPPSWRFTSEPKQPMMFDISFLIVLISHFIKPDFWSNPGDTKWSTNTSLQLSTGSFLPFHEAISRILLGVLPFYKTVQFKPFKMIHGSAFICYTLRRMLSSRKRFVNGKFTFKLN